MLSLLLNADLFDPTPRGPAHLLVAGESIVWIGSERPTLPKGMARERDLGGRRVIPGLIDGHVHLTGGGGEAGPETRVPPVALSRLTLGGVTTAVGVLGTDDAIRTPAELVTVARGLIAEGLSAYCLTGGYHVPPATVTGDVRRDIVLIDLVLGVGELAISDHRSSQPTLDELLRVAGDAHVGGLMSGKAGIVHLHVGDGARGLDLVRDALGPERDPGRGLQPDPREPPEGAVRGGARTDRARLHHRHHRVSRGGGRGRLERRRRARPLSRRGSPAERVTVSSDGGGCLPRFDGEGRVAAMDVGDPASVAGTLRELLAGGQPLERVLPAFTSNPGAPADAGAEGAARRRERTPTSWCWTRRGRWPT